MEKAEELAEGNWETILLSAGLDPSFLLYREGPCPVCGGNTRYRWRAKKESGFCNHCRFLGGFSILQHLLHTDFRGAADFVRSWAGKDHSNLPVQRKVTSPKEQSDDTEKLKEKYKKLWQSGSVITEDTATYRYLKHRVPRIDTMPKVLRHTHALDYWKVDEHNQFVKLGTYPAMLAVAQGIDNRVVNIWRTYLTPEGAKANLPDAKKAAGRFLQPSYAVRLNEPDDELGIAEGIETALAVTAMFGIPCWSTLNADGMRKFELPEGYDRVKKIRIFADNDAKDQNGKRAGNDAANFLKEKMRAKGLIATIILPKFTKFDFADIVKSK